MARIHLVLFWMTWTKRNSGEKKSLQEKTLYTKEITVSAFITMTASSRMGKEKPRIIYMVINNYWFSFCTKLQKKKKKKKEKKRRSYRQHHDVNEKM
jgi:hypothetical protein